MWQATRAITIRAPAREVWPWLVQMGYHRAGWYTFALIDNQGRRHTNRVVPDLHHLTPGDVVPDAADNYAYWVATIVEPPKALVYTTRRSLVSQRSLDPRTRHPGPISAPAGRSCSRSRRRTPLACRSASYFPRKN
jgi:proline iminopeptidase